MEKPISAAVVCLLAGFVAISSSGRDVAVTGTTVHTHPQSGVRILQGELALPSSGQWRVAEPFADAGGLRHIVLTPPMEFMRERMGERAAAIERKRELRGGRQALHAFWWPLLDYARNHDGRLPPTLDDLDMDKHRRLQTLMHDSPYAKHDDPPPPPHFALLPDARLAFPDTLDATNAWPTNRDPLVVELHPLFPDGKHFVLLTNGGVERREIDTDMLARHGLAVVPLLAETPEREPLPETVVYRIHALKIDDGEAEFTLADAVGDDTLVCQWDSEAAAPGTAEQAKKWAQHAGALWRSLAEAYDSPVLKNWLWLQERMFAVDGHASTSGWRGEPRAANATNLFNLFGGRAAMQETLQLQALELAESDPSEGPSTPLAAIQGVTVESHPFAEMLNGRPGGRLPLAEIVPVDRFFVHIAKPAALLPMLDEGADFLARAGASAVGRSLNYDLEHRYFRRLGITREWLEQLIASGLLGELAIFTPDLFVVDGTDVTAIARVPDVALLAPLLRFIGVGNLGENQVATVRSPQGREAAWARAGDIVVVGTNAREVELALELATASGDGSLGASAEFRYMLTQLPPTAQTRAYAYFSDAFIRRLVGPEVKIGQLRRLQEIAKLQAATAAAMLYGYHGQSGRPTVDRLTAKGYLPETIDFSGISLDETLVAQSERYGTLAELAPLTRTPINQATAAETKAYQAYVENYSRFWRRFFDPIAVRLDDAEDGSLEATTFILPLLDHSLYNGLREALSTAENGVPMRIPQIAPEPVAMLSLRLSETVWLDFLGEFFRDARKGDIAALEAIDDLGPAVHFALHDSDPIIAFGSGEMMGLGGNLVEFDDMLAIPLLVSLLTRPMTIAVELRDDRAMRELLRGGGLARLIPFPGERVRAHYYRLENRDAWVYALSFFGITMRYQFEIQQGYLLIANLPWGPQVKVAGQDAPAMHGLELRLNPAGAQRQLAAMFTAAAERERHLAMEGVAYLMPFVASGIPLDDALERHRRRFAFVPVHPGGGHWRVDRGRLESAVYGHPGNQRQPAYEPGDTRFGVLQGVEQVKVGMQFEGDGLRTRATWRYAKP